MEHSEFIENWGVPILCIAFFIGGFTAGLCFSYFATEKDG